MRQDNDFLRELFFEIEEAKNGFPCVLTMGASDEERKKVEHLKLLCDQGYICEENTDVYRLTSQGHDYIEAIRDPGIWKKTKDAVAKKGEQVTLEIIKIIAIGLSQGG